MIETRITPRGISYKGSPELMDALPPAIIPKLEILFNMPYAQIHTVLKGNRWIYDSTVIDCALKIIAFHHASKYDEKLNVILKQFEPKKEIE
jgi:hypothetical protein